jgi:hypothetical protein
VSIIPCSSTRPAAAPHSVNVEAIGVRGGRLHCPLGRPLSELAFQTREDQAATRLPLQPHVTLKPAPDVDWKRAHAGSVPTNDVDRRPWSDDVHQGKMPFLFYRPPLFEKGQRPGHEVVIPEDVARSIPG